MTSSNKIWEKYNCQKRMTKLENVINQIEEKVNFKIPSDYKSFAEEYKEFDDDVCGQYIILWNLEELMTNNIEYEVFKELNKTIAIGSNGGGELIALEQIDEDEIRVVITSYFLDKKDHIKIGDSFTDLFVRIESGKKWFD